MERALSRAGAENNSQQADELKSKVIKARKFDKRRAEMQDDLTKAHERKDLLRCNELDAALKASPAFTIFVAIAQDAFPVNTIVCASVPGLNVPANTAGEVIGHTPVGKVEVLFKEGESIYELASLCAADLPNGWAVKQTCFSNVEIDHSISTGQSGTVMGWSKPFDRGMIMVDFGGRQVNMLLSQIDSANKFKVGEYFFHA